MSIAKADPRGIGQGNIGGHDTWEENPGTDRKLTYHG
jgi:hypothetical protein